MDWEMWNLEDDTKWKMIKTTCKKPYRNIYISQKILSCKFDVESKEHKWSWLTLGYVNYLSLKWKFCFFMPIQIFKLLLIENPVAACQEPQQNFDGTWWDFLRGMNMSNHLRNVSQISERSKTYLELHIQVHSQINTVKMMHNGIMVQNNSTISPETTWCF